MIFVDASAFIAIITQEPDALDLSDCLEAERLRLCSAMTAWETVAGLCRSYMFSVESARARFQLFRETLNIQFVPIGEREYEMAAQAYAEFGRGRHPAALNMGDCFAYACAKANRAALLFKGDDFTKTDIRPALQR
jgi:ribonuclease VapC